MTAKIIDFPARPTEPSPAEEQRRLGDMAYRLLDKPRGLSRRPFPSNDGPEAA